MAVIRAAERFRTTQQGIETRHVFSAGPHYDPARLGIGALVGLDDHVLEPGAGFAEHAHRGVTIVSRVVAGTLLHRGDTEQVVQPGELLVQRTGTGIRHAELNASTTEALRLVQLTVLSDPDATPTIERVCATVAIGTGQLRAVPTAPAHAYVVTGHWRTDVDLHEGDFAFVEQVPQGEGELLCWCVPSNP